MAQRPLRILCLGDSLTEGYTQYGMNYHPYHRRFERKLREAFPALHVEIEEDGMAGDTTDHYSSRLTAAFRKTKMEKPYDWTIILGGTNDLASLATKPEVIFENLERTWSNAILRKSKVLALTVPEVGSVASTNVLANLNARRDRLNALIQGYSNKNFHALDFKTAYSYSAMSPEDRKRYWDDGMHYTPDGYDLMGDIIAAAFIDILKKEESAVAVQAENGALPGGRTPKRKRAFKDDENKFDEESGNPVDLHRGYVVVRRKDLD